MPTVTAQIEFEDYLGLSPEDRARIDLIASAAALEERLSSIEEIVSTLADTAALEARFQAIEANVAAIDGFTEALQARFDGSGRLVSTAIPMIPSSAIADSGTKVMMTSNERWSLGRLIPVSISTPVAVGVGKNSMFLNYTGSEPGKWTIDKSVQVVVVDNGSNPASLLTILPPSGFTLERPVVLPSRYAENPVPGAHVVCLKREVGATVFRA